MLHLLVGGQTWHAGDLDIYVPFSAWSGLVRDMESMLGARRKPLQSQEPEAFSFGQHIAKVVRVYLKGHKVDIIQSAGQAATLPLPHFHSTLLMNYLAPDHICIAYPQYTFHGIGIVHPGRTSFTNGDIAGLVKYINRGYQMRPAKTGSLLLAKPDIYDGRAGFDDEDMEDVTCAYPAICPRTDRVFGDKHSSIIPFHGNSAMFSQTCVCWKLGGWACGPECRTYTRIDVEMGCRMWEEETIFPV